MQDNDPLTDDRLSRKSPVISDLRWVTSSLDGPEIFQYLKKPIVNEKKFHFHPCDDFFSVCEKNQQNSSKTSRRAVRKTSKVRRNLSIVPASLN